VLFIQLAEHCKQATTETTICNCSPNHLYINRGRYVPATVWHTMSRQSRGHAAKPQATRRRRGLASPRLAAGPRGKAAALRARPRQSRVMSRQSCARV